MRLLYAVSACFGSLLLVTIFLLINDRSSKEVKTTSASVKRLPVSEPGVVDLIVIGDSEVSLTPEMNQDKANIAFHRFVSKIHVACQKSVRLGNAVDGGWDMCLSGPYRPKAPCLVYSFGIANDFSFDDAVSTNFGCTVRAFDPSMPVDDHKRSTNVWFYRLGIGGSDVVRPNGWTVKTLSSLLNKFNESNATIDYLKLDVENDEWEWLDEVLKTSVLSRVKQLAMEIHLIDKSRDAFLRYFRLLRRLEDAGFRRWYSALNMYNLQQTPQGVRSCCYEMVYVNVNFLDPQKAACGRIYYV